MLVTIENFSLNAIPNVSSQENSGNITIEFYVEGMNYERVLLLRSLLITKFNLLQKDIKAKGSLCAKSGNILCENTTTANAIYSIKNLIKNLSGLQPKFDAFKK